MFSAIQPEFRQRAGPRPLPAAISGLLHAAVLGAVALGPAPSEKPATLYQQVIAPNEKKIIWYRFPKKLPDVSPSPRERASQPPRIELKMPGQTIVSRAPRAPRGDQLIRQPAPELRVKQDLKLPNLLAFQNPSVPAPEVPKPKPFTPPPARRTAASAPQVAAPPPVKPAANQPLALDNRQIADALAARPKLKDFIAPKDEPRKPSSAPVLPAAPQVRVAGNGRGPGLQTNRVDEALAARPKLKAFVAPQQEPRKPSRAPVLPAAPEVGVAGGGRGPNLQTNRVEEALAFRPLPRAFVPPAAAARSESGNGNGNGKGKAAGIEEAPQLAASGPPGNLTAAVIGLKPADRLAVPLPPGSREAQFSAGPETRASGGAGVGETVETARLVIPDLLIRGGDSAPRANLLVRTPPTARENLLAASRTTIPPPVPAAEARPMATRVATGPDPQWTDRAVYTMVVQMPNVTSYAGSWIIWFADRQKLSERAPGLRAPVPLRKVDPKYIAAAAEERVEGKVQLYAVIRKDGHVEQVSLLKRLDDRLDGSAIEALRKWEFEPALRDGQPVDVDAVVEIPFRLAPRATR